MEPKIQAELQSEYYTDYLRLIDKRLGQRWSFHGAHHRHLNRFIQREVLKLTAGAKVLDGGCGTSIWLSPDLEARIAYTGIDVQDAAVAFCHQAHPARSYRVADLYRLPFADAAFDAVVLREVIEHIKQPALAVAEIVRVLKPGGKFILTTPNYGNLWAHTIEFFYHRLYLRTFRPDTEDVHPSKFDRRKLTDLLTAHFSRVAVGSIDFGINFTALAQKV